MSVYSFFLLRVLSMPKHFRAYSKKSCDWTKHERHKNEIQKRAMIKRVFLRICAFHPDSWI
jgi:hypothetical protein